MHPDSMAPPALTVAVDDTVGLWNGRLKQELEARVPLRNVLFSLSRAVVSVEELVVRFLDARSDPQLRSLRQFSHSPVAWFRSPLVQLVLVSCVEYEDYKRDLRLRLKAMADTETSSPGQPELLFVYVRPPGVDVAAKGPAKAFDAMKRDLNRKRERCVRLDLAPAEAAGGAGLLGGEEFDRQLKDALRAAFELRAAAYAEEVRRLMLSRLDPAWSFATLFLVKDGLAAMMEAAGLLEDALREYSELEACYLEALQSGQLAKQGFGSKPAGEDEAAELWASWSIIRQAASQPELVPEYVMRQALFASQARLLLKLHRHAELAERGLQFVQSFGAILSQHEQAGDVPPQLREAWSFASYVSLAAATSKQQAARAEERRRTTEHLQGRGGDRRGRLLEGVDPASPRAAPSSPPGAPWGLSKLTVKATGAGLDSDQAGSPGWQPSSKPQLDWQLGVLPAEGMAAGRGAAGRDGGAAPAAGSASLACLLGKLYCGARAELLRLGSAAGLDVPDSTAIGRGAKRQRRRSHTHTPSPSVSAPAPAAVAAAVQRAGQQQQQELGPGARLHEAGSSTDMAQVELDGTSSAVGEYQQQGAPAATGPMDDVAGEAGLKLERAVEGAADGPRGPPQLQRLQVKPKVASGDADSPSSTPLSSQRSAPDSQSEASQAAGGVSAAGSTSAAPLAAGVAQLLRPEQNELSSVERQLTSALAERPSRSLSSSPSKLHPPTPSRSSFESDVAAAAGPAIWKGPVSASLPRWLVHWRLQAVLSSQQLFIELFIELSEAAAQCYTQCGHLRHAALLRAEVADALVKAGSLQHAADVYERQCRTFLREGWHTLAAHTLPKLAACQLAAGNPALAHTAVALLSLPAPYQGSLAEWQAACQLLLQASQLAEGLAASRPLLPSSPTAGPSPAEPLLNASAFLWAAPPKASVSRFFSRSSAVGLPLLAPPARPAAAGDGGRDTSSSGGSGRGALEAAVGDVLEVQVVVENRLPVELTLSNVVLTLGVLQELTVIHSPRAPSASPSRTPSLRSSVSASLHLQPPPSPTLSTLGSARRGHSGAAAAEQEDDAASVGEPHYSSKWEQVEELQCSLLAASPGNSSGGASGSSVTLRPLSADVALPPGATTLTFLAAPVKRGLYKALHLRSRLHNLPLHVDVQTPDPVWEQQGLPLPTDPPASSGTSAGAGEVPAGKRSADAILLLVQPAQPRVQLGLMAAGGSLIAGQEQWLGLALAPERDALHGGRLELMWPMRRGSVPGLSVMRKPSANGSVHRAAQSVGGDMRLGSHGSTAGSLSGSFASDPYLRPEHKTAVLMDAQPAAGQSNSVEGSASAAEPRLLPAQRSAGPAASWLLADGLQQQLELPLVEEGRPVSIWWRVTAGEVATPPEPVYIAPPAPRHSARQLDARRLGVPGDAPAPPAAILDLPASLEYASGCQRSHTRVLPMPVRQPFTVHCVARELPSGMVAVQATLASNLALPAHLTRVAVEPQPGFLVASNLLDGMGVLPASLAPGASITAAYLLAPESSGSFGNEGTLPAKLQPSVLAIDYEIDSRQQCGLAAAALAATAPGGSTGQPAAVAAAPTKPHGSATSSAAAEAAAPSSREQTPGAAVLELLDSSSSPRKADSPTSQLSRQAGAAAGGSSGGGAEGDEEEGSLQHCTFRHLFALEMPAAEDDSSGALVYVRLLGPFTATVGQPTTLCWRLERSGRNNDAQQQATRIAFEVQAENDHWRPLGRRAGGVSLAGHDGAVATVEATWVPLAAGTLPVPALSLHDMNYQELLDVGLSGSTAIVVSEAAG